MSPKGKTPSIKPGQKVKESGIYQGTKTGQKTTLDKGEKAPPTSKPGEKWKPKVITNPK